MIVSKKVFFILALLSLFAVAPQAASWNDQSRMATIQSLVEKHTFVIDDSVFNRTNDKVYINKHFYSDKPVVPAIMGTLVYLPLYHLGIKLDVGWNFAYYLITLFTVKLFWLLGVIAFYHALSFSNISEKNRIILTFSLAFASLYFSWSSTFNNHIPAASFVIIGFYFLLKAGRQESIKRSLFFSAFFLSLAGTTDVPIGLFYVTFFIYVLMIPALRKNVIFYLLPLIITVLPVLCFNYYIHESIMPYNIVKSHFDYPGTPWPASGKLSGVVINSFPGLLYYSVHSFFGRRDFLIYNPLLLIAIPYLIIEIKNKRQFRPEVFVVAISSIIIVLYYLLMTKNYSRASYSIRWFVPFLPLLFFFMYSYFENYSNRKHRNFLLLVVISLAISAIGLINPWPRLELSGIPISANLQSLANFLLK